MEQDAKSTSAPNSKNGKDKKEPFIPRCLTKKQINYIKFGIIGLIVILAMVHAIPRAFAVAPAWVKEFFMIYIFYFAVPRGLFRALDKTRKD